MDSHQILIVDTGSDVRDTLTTVLRARDWEVESALEAWNALARIQSTAYDVVLMNLTLPDMHGLELLERIRMLRPETRVVVMAGSNTPAQIVGAIRQQAFGCLCKPFSVAAAVEMLSAALETSSWGDDIQVVCSRPEWVTLRVRCKLETADRLLAFLREMNMDLPQRQREDVAASVRELLANAIEHGGGSDPQQRILISYIRTRGAIIYHIQDPGGGFSFETLEHAAVRNPPDEPIRHAAIRQEQGFRPGGFGILLARYLVDELIYNEKGNEVLFLKYL